MLREANRVQTNALQSAKEKANDTHYTEVRFPSNPFNREIIPPRARFPPAALSSLVASPPAGFGPITVEKRQTRVIAQRDVVQGSIDRLSSSRRLVTAPRSAPRDYYRPDPREAMTTSWRPPRHIREMTFEQAEALRKKWCVRERASVARRKVHNRVAGWRFERAGGGERSVARPAEARADRRSRSI